MLAAVGTVLAFVVAFAQIRGERHARQRQEADTRRKERREQGERVSAWLFGPDLETHPEAPPVERPALGIRDRTRVWTYRLRAPQAALWMRNLGRRGHGRMSV